MRQHPRSLWMWPESCHSLDPFPFSFINFLVGLETELSACQANALPLGNVPSPLDPHAFLKTEYNNDYHLQFSWEISETSLGEYLTDSNPWYVDMKCLNGFVTHWFWYYQHYIMRFPLLILVPFSVANIESQLFIIHKVSFHFLSVCDTCSLSFSPSHLQSPSNPSVPGDRKQ